tara:strand:+ start:38 stop:241 length:204 start_codon:yes stop_codon:yes gene_type:complete
MSLKDKKIYYFDKTTNQTNSITINEILMVLERLTSQDGNAMKFFCSENERDESKHEWNKFLNNLNKN